MTDAELQAIRDALAAVPKSIHEGGYDYQNRLLDFAYFMRDSGVPALLADVDRLRQANAALQDADKAARYARIGPYNYPA